MNYRLIEENLKYCEAKEKENPLEACRGALAIVSLIIQQASVFIPKKKKEEFLEDEIAYLRQIYGVAAGGISAQLKSLTSVIESIYQPTANMPGMKEFLDDCLDEFEKKEAAYKEEMKLNAKLIKQAQKLNEVIENLKQIEIWKAEGLKDLEKQIETQKKANDMQETLLQEKDNELQKLKEEFAERQGKLQQYEAALQENSSLLGDLPEKYGISTIDEALTVASGAEQEAKEILEKSDAVLRTVIQAVDIFYNGKR